MCCLLRVTILCLDYSALLTKSSFITIYSFYDYSILLEPEPGTPSKYISLADYFLKYVVAAELRLAVPIYKLLATLLLLCKFVEIGYFNYFGLTVIMV